MFLKTNQWTVCEVELKSKLQDNKTSKNILNLAEYYLLGYYYYKQMFFKSLDSIIDLLDKYIVWLVN